MNAGCFAHGETILASGYFFHGQIGRKYAWGRLKVDGVNYDVQLRLERIHRQQRGQKLEGRYFGLSRQGCIHLCHCRFTRAEIEVARREAVKMMAAVKFE